MKRRARTRAQAGNHDHAFDKVTTTTDPTSTWNSLDSETQAFQAMLEAVRLDPDDPELADDLQKARAAMQVAWLNNQPILPAAEYSRRTFATILLIHQIAVARAFVVRHRLHMQHGHRRRPRP